MNCYGKETIDTNTYGKSIGHSGSYSTNYQISGRELLTPDEVRMLQNEYAIQVSVECRCLFAFPNKKNPTKL